MSPPDDNPKCPSCPPGNERVLQPGEKKCPACSAEAANRMGFFGKVGVTLVGVVLVIVGLAGKYLSMGGGSNGGVSSGDGRSS